MTERLHAHSYRGYGQSQGVPSEAGIRLDAQAALEHLLAREDINKSLVGGCHLLETSNSLLVAYGLLLPPPLVQTPLLK